MGFRRTGQLSEAKSPCKPQVCEDAIVRWRIKWLREMMVGSTDATLTVSTALNHYMHREDPELILSGIRRVIAVAAKRASR